MRLLTVLLPLFSGVLPILSFTVNPLPDPDGNLHIFKLPTGQGGAHVIQCPNGDLSIFDMGAASTTNPRFMKSAELQQFFSGKADRIRNVLLSHLHTDHYYLFNDAFPSLPNLQNFYTSCTSAQLPSEVSNWLSAIGASSKVRSFNSGNECGPVGPSCGDIPICPSNAGIRAQVLAANLGQHCTDGGNKNMDSIYMKISWGSFAAHLQGDFEDETAASSGPQTQLVNFYGSQLQATVYSLSHHGAEELANKDVLRRAVNPKAIWSDGDSAYSYNHPRCNIIDAFISLGSLCKPGASSSSQYYCGAHIYSSLPAAKKVQATYSCGFDDPAPDQTRTNNDWAIFTTVPDGATINIVKVSTNGNQWGFTTDVFATP